MLDIGFGHLWPKARFSTLFTKHISALRFSTFLYVSHINFCSTLAERKWFWYSVTFYTHPVI